MNAPAGSRFVSGGPWVILLAIAAGVALLLLAMLRYPGGTAVDPTTVGHSFWTNFLCDLTNQVAANGEPNQASARLARLGLLSLCLALAAFWSILPRSFGPRFSRAQSRALRGFGLLSIAGLLVAPVASGWMHVVAVFASTVPALLAGILALVGTFAHARTLGLVSLAFGTVLTAGLDAVLYARSYLHQPRVVHPALPMFQRVALIFMLLWMIAVALRALRKGSADPQAGTNR